MGGGKSIWIYVILVRMFLTQTYHTDSGLESGIHMGFVVFCIQMTCMANQEMTPESTPDSKNHPQNLTPVAYPRRHTVLDHLSRHHTSIYAQTFMNHHE